MGAQMPSSEEISSITVNQLKDFFVHHREDVDGLLQAMHIDNISAEQDTAIQCNILCHKAVDFLRNDLDLVVLGAGMLCKRWEGECETATTDAHGCCEMISLTDAAIHETAQHKDVAGLDHGPDVVQVKLPAGTTNARAKSKQFRIEELGVQVAEFFGLFPSNTSSASSLFERGDPTF